MAAKMLNLKTAVAYVRALPGVEKVVLPGHSGSGTLISAYQTIAENGVAPVRRRRLLRAVRRSRLPA